MDAACKHLAEHIGEAGKGAHTRAHVEVLPLDVERENVSFNSLNGDSAFPNACAFGREVAARAILARFAAVKLDQLG